mmetsp:Transcript_16673/g.30195  ORF Transcript_16673/g.30195 Transcript_16673/m.30195 type:complete len:375 (-) Transcript_16673:203-1327(-)
MRKWAFQLATAMPPNFVRPNGLSSADAILQHVPQLCWFIFFIAIRYPLIKYIALCLKAKISCREYVPSLPSSGMRDFQPSTDWLACFSTSTRSCSPLRMSSPRLYPNNFAASADFQNTEEEGVSLGMSWLTFRLFDFDPSSSPFSTSSAIFTPAARLSLSANSVERSIPNSRSFLARSCMMVRPVKPPNAFFCCSIQWCKFPELGSNPHRSLNRTSASYASSHAIGRYTGAAALMVFPLTTESAVAAGSTTLVPFQSKPIISNRFTRLLPRVFVCFLRRCSNTQCANARFREGDTLQFPYCSLYLCRAVKCFPQFLFPCPRPAAFFGSAISFVFTSSISIVTVSVVAPSFDLAMSSTHSFVDLGWTRPMRSDFM